VNKLALARRIDRGIRDRDKEEVNECQAEPNGDAGKADSRALRGSADDYVQEEKSGDDFDQEAQRLAAGETQADVARNLCRRRRHARRGRRPAVK